MKQWHKSASLREATRFAIRGIVVAGKREQNVRIHFLVAILVVCALVFLRASVLNIAIALLAIILVIGFEIINTSIELLADLVHPEYSGVIRDVKDIAAGAVLLSSILAILIGLLIFLSTIQS